ncbi:MAG: AgmX/PglI C-terminal domain-containing protein [Myxococcales bacterium]|nr:AgmX/PglI C-terminal domain-containing protein [Myxococcales bacterium]
MQQQPQSMRPSARPGRMTAVMRAVSQQAGPKILRIGVVQAGKVVDERLIKQRVDVTIGPSEKNTFVVPSRKIPPNFKLFALIANEYHLNFLDGMGGRVALKTGISELAALKAQAKAISEKGATYYQTRISDDARGKVVVGDTTFLFQFVVPPPAQPKPQLPVSVRKGVAGDIDWFTTIVAAFSFLLHFFLVALVYSDWMDPVLPDEDAVISQLIEQVKALPPPPVQEKQKSDEPTPTDKAVAATEAPKQATASAGGKPSPSDPNAGAKSADAAKAAADAKATELSSALAELDVQTLGALGQGGVATEGVLGTGEVPAGMLDSAARSDAGAGSGDPSGLRGLGSTGRGGTGPLGGNEGRDVGFRGQDGIGATVAAKTVEVKGPVGNASVGGASVSGGKVAGASGVVGRMKGRFRQCYQSGLNSNPELAGSVTLVAKVGENGEVRSVSGGGGALAAISGCLKSVVQSASFAPPEGGSAVIAIPITFVKQ